MPILAAPDARPSSPEHPFPPIREGFGNRPKHRLRLPRLLVYAAVIDKPTKNRAVLAMPPPVHAFLHDPPSIKTALTHRPNLLSFFVAFPACVKSSALR